MIPDQQVIRELQGKLVRREIVDRRVELAQLVIPARPVRQAQLAERVILVQRGRRAELVRLVIQAEVVRRETPDLPAQLVQQAKLETLARQARQVRREKPVQLVEPVPREIQARRAELD